jgi:hypothetical protein
MTTTEAKLVVEVAESLNTYETPPLWDTVSSFSNLSAIGVPEASPGGRESTSYEIKY